MDSPVGKAKTPADEKRREQVLVGAALAGLVLTLVLVRRSGSKATALPVSAPVGAPGSGSGVQPGDFSSLQNQVWGLSGGITALSAMLARPGATSSPTPISRTPAPVAAGSGTGPARANGNGANVEIPTGWTANELGNVANINWAAVAADQANGIFQQSIIGQTGNTTLTPIGWTN